MRVRTLVLLAIVLGCSDTSGPDDPDPGTSGPISGSGSSLVAESIPRLAYVPREEDFSTTHPELTGVPVSFNTVALTFARTTTVSQANTLLVELNATIVGGIPGKANAASGIVFLRLSTTTHPEMIAKLAQLRSDPRVLNVVQDVLLQPMVIPNERAPHNALGTWTWQVEPAGANWGLEAIRAPQMWALNSAITKAGGQQPSTLVFDDGFEASHEDLTYAAPLLKKSHGTHVAGTIGAKFSNKIGVDGVNPFANLMVRSFASWGATIAEIEALARANASLRVINTSLGYNWINNNPAPTNFSAGTNNPQQVAARNHGAIVFEMLKGLEASGVALPVWVTAAGNDSNSPFGDQFAVWASPFANAALEHGAKNIIVVEAVDRAALGSQALRRAAFSNLNGHLSAPGAGIVSTDTLPVRYSSKSGTSMATPHVAGLVGYLYSLDPNLPRPTLAANAILDLLLANAVPTQGAKPSIDAYATVMDVDRIRNNSRVLTMMLDIDDGTADGNQRTNSDNTLFTADAKGDGKVNIRDFRRWRDWAAGIHFWEEEFMDGGTLHPKKELNGNDSVGTDTEENIFPRGDFNGDGTLQILSTIRSRVPGVINASVTDLEVMQSIFSDSTYVKTDLPNLVLSGDLHFDASGCLSGSGVAAVRSYVHPQGSAALVQPSREHTSGPGVSQIYTVPVDAINGTRFTMRLVALNAAGSRIDSVAKDTVLRLAEDVRYRPTCNIPVVAVTVSPTSANVGLGQTRQFTATVTGTQNTQVVWTTTATGSTISGSGLLTAGQTSGTFEVRATSVADPTKSATAQITVGSTFQVGDVYVGTRKFQDTSNPFPVALIFNQQKNELLQCISPSAGNQPNDFRRICATMGGDFTDRSGYIILSVTFNGNSITGFATGGDGGPGSNTTISLTLEGTKLTGRLNSPPNLFTTYDTTKR